MELTRRHFIQFLVGGAAGINFTPLPWKFTDDLAIWTQNWPWVPVPDVGEATLANSVCMLCPGGCGIEVRKVDERAVKIEGRTDYPVNPGGLCPLGMGGLQLLYNESIRFTGPMRRVGPRGSGKFMNISWDEALSLLAGRISALRKNGRPEALAAIDGNSQESTLSVMIERLLRAIGSPNYVRIPLAEDTYRIAARLMLGAEGPMAYDLENSDYILSFGSGLLEGWGAPGRVLNAWGLWHGNSAGGKPGIVQVESRASNTASKADRWVPAKPGTEAALALGLAHVISKEGLYDFEFVKGYSFGFDDWRSADGKDHMGFKTMVSENYSPARVADITGLKSDEIVSLARAFGKAKAPVAICGKGKGALNGSTWEFMSVQALNALKGRLNRPGGVLVHNPLPLSPLPKIELDAVAQKGLKKPRLDNAGSPRYPFTQSLVNLLADTIMNSPGSPVDTLLVFSANPAYTLPDAGSFRKALKEIPYVVSFSPFRDETAYLADLILPDHTYLEKMDDVVWPTGLQYPLYGLSTPVLEPVYDTRNTGDVITRLAKGVGGSVAPAFPWKNFEAVIKVRAEGLFASGKGLVDFGDSTPIWERQKAGGDVKPGFKSFKDMWKKVKSGGLWYAPAHTYKNWDGLFETPTGKFEFFSSQIELAQKDMGLEKGGDLVAMPHFEESGGEADHAAYPLRMMPYEMINLAGGWIPNPPFANKTLFDNQLIKDESFAEINPKTAAQHDLKQGERVMVQSPTGRISVRVNLFEGAMPGIVYLPLGFGHTAYDEFLRGKGANPNEIVEAGKDPLSGHPIWWNTRVRITKV